LSFENIVFIYSMLLEKGDWLSVWFESPISVKPKWYSHLIIPRRKKPTP